MAADESASVKLTNLLHSNKKLPISVYFSSLSEQIADNISSDLFVKYREISDKSLDNAKSPFASVIIRTQGKRPESLREALICLFAQTMTDFEIVIVGHKLDDSQRHLVQSIIDEQEQSFREKIRLISVNHGGRSTPLNYGFAEARGKYVMIFDDDDIVMDDWMETFYNLSKENNGMILHSFCFEQNWSVVDVNGSDGLRAESAPDAQYCAPFILLKQMKNNYCPPISLAFPSYLFKELGFIFDESLNTSEDWDYLMRCARISGVANEPNSTSIYRHWVNAESSTTVHSKAEWKSDFEHIEKGIVSCPYAFILDDYAYALGISDTRDVAAKDGNEKALAIEKAIIAVFGADSVVYSLSTKLYTIFFRKWVGKNQNQ